jgi:hypothetical protein
LVRGLKGSHGLGLYLIYLFLAVIGAYCEIQSVIELEQVGLTLLLFTSIAVLLHGVLVVFFGGLVPKPRVEKAFSTLAESDCILVIGSSLKVFSGFRFPRWAGQNNLPMYAVNQGEMRGQELFDCIVTDPCEDIMPIIAQEMS